MREILEGTAARLAAENATPAEVALMRDLHGAFEQAREPADHARINKQFHDAISGAVRNRYFHGPLEGLQDALALLGPTTFSVAGRAHPAVAEHRLTNQHVKDGVQAAEFIALREARDRTLSLPVQILHALQVNLRGGRLPEKESDGHRYFKVPANRF